MYKKVISALFISVVAVLSVLGSSAPQLTEASKVSLLTCSPSDEAIYALFGHAGLRIQDDSLKIDAVFDYGIFDFSSDNFIFRFVKGETDYMVLDRRFSSFIREYDFRGVGVTEQILNLKLAERQNIFDALVENIQPENRIYRYNFFYDNCATRPRDIITKSLEGEIKYTSYSGEQTYRDLLEECLLITPWSRFGIYLVIGSGADRVIDEREKDFIPNYVLMSFNHANILDSSGNLRVLVSSSDDLLVAEDGGYIKSIYSKKRSTKKS